MDGRMVIGMNKHREICTLQITGQMLLMKDQVFYCCHVFMVRGHSFSLKIPNCSALLHNCF